MNRVQIVWLESDKDRWEFLAHGAAYDRDEADRAAVSILARGGKVRFLPVPKTGMEKLA